MSYIINNSRGNVVAIVADGTANTTATNLTLVGRGVTNYGTYENENYVYLLENFAKSSAPTQPILGQLWYNSTTDVISSYGTTNTWAPLATQDYVRNQLATGNIATSGNITAAGNITGSNLLTNGNIKSTGSISATGNVIGANFIGNVIPPAGGAVSTTGNVTGGNILTVGIVSATGNITTVGTLFANTVIANNVVTTGTSSAFRLPNLNQSQINALSANNGDMVYNTTTDLPQIYQSGVWKNFTIAYYS
jgi:hypothetical protein